jgi:hypothetical protein
MEAVAVIRHTKKDERGREQFTLLWKRDGFPDDDRIPPRGPVLGQVFFANADEYVETYREGGVLVREFGVAQEEAARAWVMNPAP